MSAAAGNLGIWFVLSLLAWVLSGLLLGFQEHSIRIAALSYLAGLCVGWVLRGDIR